MCATHNIQCLPQTQREHTVYKWPRFVHMKICWVCDASSQVSTYKQSIKCLFQDKSIAVPIMILIQVYSLSKMRTSLMSKSLLMLWIVFMLYFFKYRNLHLNLLQNWKSQLSHFSSSRFFRIVAWILMTNRMAKQTNK